MTTLIAAVAFLFTVIGIVFGYSFGMRHLADDCEMGYLSGHVDGYIKAEHDLGEVPL